MIKKITYLIISASMLGACVLFKSADEPDVLLTATTVLLDSDAEVPQPLITSTPSPTLVFEHLISDGDRAFVNGDWDVALQAYLSIIAENPSQDHQSAAWLGLGRVYRLLDKPSESIHALEILINEYQNFSHHPQGYVALAETYTDIGRYQEAAIAYNAYMELRPGLVDSYIQEKRADAFWDAGDFIAAIGAYQAALASPRVGDTQYIEIKIARAYAAVSDWPTALIAYQDIYNRATNDYTKAYLDFLLGQAFTALEQPDQANAVYLDAVENFPLSYDSYQALILLVEAGFPVSELDRGIVDYYAGQYSLAIEAFDRYLNTTSEQTATAAYFKGLSYRALGNTDLAIENWELLIQAYPDDERWDDAWEQAAYTQWAYLDQYEMAKQTLLDFVDQSPWHPRAPEFLFDAGRISERDGNLEESAAIWERIAPEYPSSNFVPRAIFLAGISYYRLQDYRAAENTFQRYLGTSAALQDQSAAYFWIAKSFHALGDEDAAQAAWQRAANVDPTGYYSERARDILLGRQPFFPPIMYDIGFDTESEQAEAEAWIRTKFTIPAEIDLSDLGSLSVDQRLIRGTALWSLAFYDHALEEFNSLRADILLSPDDNYRLANYLVELGFYAPAIFAAREVLNLNQMDDADTMNAPSYFNHLRFGSYYGDLIIPIAQNNDFHPLLVFSVVRQESLFSGLARSSAGASGLMQVIPSTGAGIAEQLGWPLNYSASDLYRPYVSVKFGVDYLDTQRNYFEGDLYATLAAYNGGPGNAAVWKKLAGDDPDLFLEIIRFQETRDYVRGVFENFAIYRRLYDRSP
ncbi:MAG: tetratricopeptide repeat protein [Anaerolineae bacterium]|nr:tetratricopeptide repeat protein [Anaerolineae bacterium]